MKWNKLFKNKSSGVLLKNISYLAGGQMIAQLISLLGAFFIPRLLGPENYGEYQVIINYVLMYKLLTFTGVNKVNIREIAKDVSKVSEIINNSLFFRLVFSAVSVVISLLVLVFLDYSETVVIGIVVFSAFLVLFSIENTVTTVFYALQKLQYVSYLNIIKSIVQVSFSIAALLLGYGVLSLVIIYLLAELVIILVGIRFILRHTNYRPELNYMFDKGLIKRAYKFSIIDFFNLLSSKIDIVMLSFLADPVGVGVYALAN
ncbi:MAG: oligosaccharide flippase family protein, partial [Bacteroidota bacterium]